MRTFVDLGKCRNRKTKEKKIEKKKKTNHHDVMI